MCLYPKLIKNPKYKPNKKNGWNPPPVYDERVRDVPIGCTRCMECKKQKVHEWRARLLDDIIKNKNGKFITLTFSSEWLQKLDTGYVNENGQLVKGIHQYASDEKEIEGYERENLIATLAVRHFLERWRKKYGKSLRHWLVTELGHKGTEHIHIHGIVWTDETFQTIKEKWQYGYVYPGKENYYTNYVNEKTVNYVTKYILKTDLQHKYYQPIILTSAGIGANYAKCYNATLNKYNGKETREYFKSRQGFKLALPIYWRNKIYTEEEREKLWLHRLDKKERYVLGQKISIENGEENYYKALAEAQKLNKSLYYGSDQKSWSREKYERERRNIIFETRTNTLTPSARSLAKGLGLKYTTLNDENTSHLEGGQQQIKSRTDVAPAVGYENYTTIYHTKWYITENGITTEPPH